MYRLIRWTWAFSVRRPQCRARKASRTRSKSRGLGASVGPASCSARPPRAALFRHRSVEDGSTRLQADHIWPLYLRLFCCSVRIGVRGDRGQADIAVSSDRYAAASSSTVDVGIILVLMLLVLAFIIFLPHAVLFLQRLIMPKFV